MRTLGELNKATRTRLSDYISKWPTLGTTQLAEDLYLRPTTVAAVRANLTRKLSKKFNEYCGG